MNAITLVVLGVAYLANLVVFFDRRLHGVWRGGWHKVQLVGIWYVGPGVLILWLMVHGNAWIFEHNLVGLVGLLLFPFTYLIILYGTILFALIYGAIFVVVGEVIARVLGINRTDDF